MWQRSGSVTEAVLEINETVKLAVLGAAAVGKTSIVQQFLFDCFLEEHIPTVEHTYHTIYHTPKSKLFIDILDTSGSLPFATRENIIRTNDGFILVYVMGDKESFKYARGLKSEINALRPGENIPIIVVGNKSDLEASKVVDGNQTDDEKVENAVVTMDWSLSFSEK